MDWLNRWSLDMCIWTKFSSMNQGNDLGISYVALTGLRPLRPYPGKEDVWDVEEFGSE